MTFQVAASQRLLAIKLYPKGVCCIDSLWFNKRFASFEQWWQSASRLFVCMTAKLMSAARDSIAVVLDFQWPACRWCRYIFTPLQVDFWSVFAPRSSMGSRRELSFILSLQCSCITQQAGWKRGFLTSITRVIIHRVVLRQVLRFCTKTVPNRPCWTTKIKGLAYGEDVPFYPFIAEVCLTY